MDVTRLAIERRVDGGLSDSYLQNKKYPKWKTKYKPKNFKLIVKKSDDINEKFWGQGGDA